MGTATSSYKADPLTLDAEAELLLLVGDVAGDGANQGHGQGTGHTSNGASLWRHSWVKVRVGEMRRLKVKLTVPQGSAQTLT